MLRYPASFLPTLRELLRAFPSQVPEVGNISAPSNVWKVVVVLEPGQSIQDINENTIAFAVDFPNYSSGESERGVPGSPEVPIKKDWKFYVASINDLEEVTNYDFLSNIPKNIQEIIENNSDISKLPDLLSSSLQASSELDNTLLNPFKSGTNIDSPIRHSQIPNQSIIHSKRFDVGRSSQAGVNQNTFFKVGIVQVSPKITPSQIRVFQTGFSQVHIDPFHMVQSSPSNIGSTQINVCQTAPNHLNSTQVSVRQISVFDANICQNSTSQINLSQIGTTDALQTNMTQFNPGKVSFASSIPSEQFFSIHNSTPQIINELNNSASTIWSGLFKSETSLDINFQITNLPSGQLAEATITSFDDSGVPNAGTIYIDSDANGVGWFIDSTPQDNNEFTSNTETYFLAEPDSEASGKYDLLTTVLHELAHLYGFIEGYKGFDELKAQGIIVDDFTATFDGEHLDKQAHPYDLLNTHLAPGIRKLPSQLDVQILKAIEKTEEKESINPVSPRIWGLGGQITAPLTSSPLLGILNGDFSTSNYGWNTRGDSNIEQGQAILSEDSPFLSNITQTFTIPENAKTLQFTLVDTELGASELAPPDAFEVALLDADTNQPLTTTSGLTQTDSLINIQNDGLSSNGDTTYFSREVRIGGTKTGQIIDLHKSRTITIDISHLNPGTEATLYFDLLGFGAADSRVLIDDVRLSEQNLLPPVVTDDTATTTQGQAVIIDILTNDTDDDGTIATNSIQIQNEPQHGSVIPRPDGKISYTPGARFVGEDTFTYTVSDNDGQQSNPATVSVSVQNAAPEIAAIQIPEKSVEARNDIFGGQ